MAMEQHIKTDLKLMIKEADKTALTSFNTPSTVTRDITNEQALALADTLMPILPPTAAFSKVMKTEQVAIIQSPPVE